MKRSTLLQISRDLAALLMFGSALSCNPPGRPVESSGDCGIPIKGDFSQLTLVPDPEGVTFDAPRACVDNTTGETGYYLRVIGHGARSIDYARSTPTDCDRPDADAAACPSVSVHVLGPAILDALRKGLGEMNADSFGLGVCARAVDPLEKWNLSSRVHDWRFADQALTIIDAELRRWNMDGEYGLSISGVPCAVVE